MRFEVSGLSVSVGRSALLSGVSFSLGTGEAFGVTGVSGSGKSTLLRALAGLHPIDGGSVALDGKAPPAHGWPAYRRRVVYVSQQPVLVEGTVEASLARPFAYATSGEAFPRDEAVERLAALALPDDVISREASRLSVGQQQRVALVRALLVKPAVLLLDEPFSALDPDAQGHVVDGLRSFLAHGGMIVVGLHDPEQTAGWCTAWLSLADVHAGEGPS